MDLFNYIAFVDIPFADVIVGLLCNHLSVHLRHREMPTLDQTA